MEVLNSKDSRSFDISLRERLTPNILLTLSIRTRTGGRCGKSPRESKVPGVRVAPDEDNISANLCIAKSAISGSAPLSNREEASLRSPSLRAVAEIEIGSHHAISNAIVFVS